MTPSTPIRPQHPAQPLQGKRLVLTRSAADNARWAGPLRALGAEVCELACIETEPLASRDELEAELAVADWVVLSSRRAAEIAIEQLTGNAGDMLPWERVRHARPRLACVGAATALAALPLFGTPACTASGGTMASLGEELVLLTKDEFKLRIVELAAEGGRRDLAQAFEKSAHELHRLELYRTFPACSNADPLPPLQRLAGGPVDLVLLASPSAWTGLQGLASLPKHLPCITLGPTTSAALIESGQQPRAQALTRDLTGMIDAACRALRISPAAFLPKS